MAKKKKSIFKIRYFLILLALYFLCRILMAYLPVGKASINYSGDITEKGMVEVGGIVKKVGIDNLKELEDSIKSLSWVESAEFKRNILRELKIFVVSRVPVARVANIGGKVIDKEGNIFDFDRADSLVEVELSEGVSEREIARAIGILKFLPDFNIDRIRIDREGVRTESLNLDILWGNDEFKRKSEVMNVILGDNITAFKGTLDFRFKNMVVLRR